MEVLLKYLIKNSDIEGVFRRRFSVQNPVDKKLSCRRVKSKDRVDIAIRYDVQQIAVEAQIAVVRIYLKMKRQKLSFRFVLT